MFTVAHRAGLTLRHLPMKMKIGGTFVSGRQARMAGYVGTIRSCTKRCVTFYTSHLSPVDSVTRRKQPSLQPWEGKDKQQKHAEDKSNQA